MKEKQWDKLEGRAKSFDAACRVTHPEVMGVSSPAFDQGTVKVIGRSAIILNSINPEMEPMAFYYCSTKGQIYSMFLFFSPLLLVLQDCIGSEWVLPEEPVRALVGP